MLGHPSPYWIHGEADWMASEGTSGSKVLDPVFINIICCPLGEGFCSLTAPSTAAPGLQSCSHWAWARTAFGVDISWALPVSQALC